MKKTLITVGFLLLGALPAAAQSSEVNLLVGGAKTLKSPAGKSEFRHGFEEVSYGMQLDPGTIFKIKVGRMDTTTVFRDHVPGSPDDHDFVYTADPNGQVEYADAAVEYRFAEPFGYTGVFGGTGLYRQHSSQNRTSSGYGFVLGVNGLFPVTRNVGIVAEGAVHWAHFYSPRSRFGTLGVGLRFGF